jgi:hypothetical protein
VTRRTVKAWLGLTALLVVALAAAIIWRYAPSAAMMLDLSGTSTALRRWLPARVYDVAHEDLTVPSRHGMIAARAYRPAIVVTRSLILFPGIHAGSVDEPRLDRFARRLAASGAVVLSVPLPDLRRYRVTPASTDVIEDATAWMASQPALAPQGRVGLVGVSFAGGLVLVAAGRPSLDGKVSFVVSLGGHGDLPRVMAYLCAVRPPASSEPPPHDYGAAVIVLAALPRLLPRSQLEAADSAITAFLDASSLASTDAAAAEALFVAARAAGDRLPEPARTIAGLVNDRRVAELGARAAPWIEELGGSPALSPLRSPATRAPVFLLHGVNDAVIPTSETPSVAEYLAAKGNSSVRWLLTPLLTHADVRADAPAADVWRLVRFWRGILDAFD